MCLCLPPPTPPYVCLDSPFAFCGPIFPTGNGNEKKGCTQKLLQGKAQIWCFLNNHKVTLVQENSLLILSKSAEAVYVAKIYSLVHTRAKRTTYTSFARYLLPQIHAPAERLFQWVVWRWAGWNSSISEEKQKISSMFFLQSDSHHTCTVPVYVDKSPKVGLISWHRYLQHYLWTPYHINST